MSGTLPKFFSPRYNWPVLKLEFMRGSWMTTAQYRRDKKFPPDEKSDYMTIKMRGWTTEKQKLIAEAAKNATGDLLAIKTEEFKKMRERQVKLAQMMQLKGAEGLQDLKPEDVEQARKLLLSGLQEERAALGVNEKGGSQNLTQVNVNLPKTSFDKIIDGQDYEGILRLIANVRRERTRRIGGGVVIEGETETESGGTE